MYFNTHISHYLSPVLSHFSKALVFTSDILKRCQMPGTPQCSVVLSSNHYVITGYSSTIVTTKWNHSKQWRIETSDTPGVRNSTFSCSLYCHCGYFTTHSVPETHELSVFTQSAVKFHLWQLPPEQVFSLGDYELTTVTFWISLDLLTLTMVMGVNCIGGSLYWEQTWQ